MNAEKVLYHITGAVLIKFILPVQSLNISNSVKRLKDIELTINKPEYNVTARVTLLQPPAPTLSAL